MGDHAGLLQVTVRDGSVGIVKGHKKFLHLDRERMSPDVGLFINAMQLMDY